jgi:hypothetical protein
MKNGEKRNKNNKNNKDSFSETKAKPSLSSN